MDKNRRNRGFTLLEILVALAIMSIVMTSIMGVYASTSRTHTTQQVTSAVQETVRTGMGFMVRDLRMAGLDPQETDGFGIEEATSTKIRFTADRGNQDGVVDDSDLERLSYELRGSQIWQILYEGQGVGVEEEYPMVDNVSDLTFTYLDVDGNDLGDPVAAADLVNIRTVQIDMTVTEVAAREGTVTRSSSVRVLCRNLGYGT